MTWPPPKTGPLPPPSLPLWAPRTRRWLQRGLIALDRRKARRWSDINMTYMDQAWLTAYAVWWDREGWMEGAPPPEKAWQHLIDSRRGKPTT